MPCNTITLNEVEIHAANLEGVSPALLGWGV